MSKKQANLERLKSLCKSTEAVQVFNPEINKNDVKIKVGDNEYETVYSYKGSPGWAFNLINNIKGRGAILAYCGIETLRVTPESGTEYVLKRGEEKVKASRKATGGSKAVTSTFKPIKVKVLGCDKLEGETKEGLIVGMAAGAYIVEFKSAKMGVTYSQNFNKKTGLQSTPRPFHSWRIDTDSLKSA